MAISLIAYGCILGAMLVGMFLRGVLHESHVSDESKDVMKLGANMIATLAAVVLGLLVASAKSNYDTINNGIVQLSSKIILTDRVLAHYGPETKEIRDQLRLTVAASIERHWPKEKTGQKEDKTSNSMASLEAIQDKIRQLSPKNTEQSWLRSRASLLCSGIAESRLLIVEQRGHTSLPMPFFVVLVSWLMIIFFIFGLLSPRNATVILVLLVCALSTTGSLYLIQELDRPYGGFITNPSGPLRNALSILGR